MIAKYAKKYSTKYLFLVAVKSSNLVPFLIHQAPKRLTRDHLKNILNIHHHQLNSVLIAKVQAFLMIETNRP
jgi:hypothetical protein